MECVIECYKTCIINIAPKKGGFMNHEKQIVFLKMRPKNSDLKFIEERIRDWLEINYPNTSLNEIDYFVCIERKTLPLFFYCRVSVTIDGDEWTAINSARSLYKAIKFSFDTLKKISKLKPSNSKRVESNYVSQNGI